MKKMFLSTLCCALLCTGCWDKQELNELGIVMAIGLDQDTKTEEIILTTQLVRPGALKKEAATQKPPIEIISSKGKTIFEAMRNITKTFDRRPNFSHDQVIVISESLAREGLLKLIDVLMRSQEIRRTVWIIVAKDTSAKEILGVEHGIESVQATYLNNIIKSRNRNSESNVANLLEITKALLSGTMNPITGSMEIVKQSNLPDEEEKKPTTQGVILSGTAVFKKDKLVGFLNERETRGVNWITGKVKSGVIQVPALKEKKRLITIEIKRASSIIKPKIKDGKISFDIIVKEEGNIVEQQSIIDSSKLDIFDRIAKEQKKVIKDEIKMAFDKAQKKYGSDIFGFGNALSQSHPKMWKRIKGNWDHVFPKVSYTVKIDTRLRRSGLLLKPIKPQE